MQATTTRHLVQQYERELVRLRFKESTIGIYREFWTSFIRFCDGLHEQEFSAQTAFRFLYERYGIVDTTSPSQLTRHQQHLRQMVRKLIHFHVHGAVGRPNRVPQRSVDNDRLAEVLGAYAAHCVEHGYATSTRKGLRADAVRFMVFVESQGLEKLSELTSMSIIEYVESLSIYSYRSIGLALGRLRTLLRFLYADGYLAEDLSAAVPRQQERRDTTVTAVWSQADVLRLLDAIDRGNPCGKRDYAILLLVTRLGIRASDIRKLKLGNLRWESYRIEFTQSKTGRNVSLPLLRDVGWAIIDYLEHGRPHSESPYVFLKQIAPYGQLSEGTCFRHIIARCCKLSRLSRSYGEKIGMHSLRHTLATVLLEKHTPLPVISEILGHESRDSTSVYLRTHDAALRECAMDVQEATQ
jgi:site-specific recombinase XerD